MSEREEQLERECQLLKSEVAALEALVGRYQDELYAAASAGAGSDRCTPQLPRPLTRTDARITRVEDVLLEHQRLYPSGWGTRATRAGDRPALSRPSGEPSAFDKVALPSSDWEWVSDWHPNVDAHTDESGWQYAASWGALDSDRSTEHEPSSEKTLEHRVRRRVWKRERMLIRASGLPAVLNRQLELESRVTAAERANGKLTQQLLFAQERLRESDERARVYESQLVRLQDIVHRLSHKRSRVSSRAQSWTTPAAATTTASLSPRFSTSATHNADVLSQTEALLDQILSGPGLANLDLATTIDAQERRSIMVEACQQELQDAVNEFHSLIGKAEQQHQQRGTGAAAIDDDDDGGETDTSSR